MTAMHCEKLHALYGSDISRAYGLKARRWPAFAYRRPGEYHRRGFGALCRAHSVCTRRLEGQHQSVHSLGSDKLRCCRRPLKGSRVAWTAFLEHLKPKTSVQSCQLRPQVSCRALSSQSSRGWRNPSGSTRCANLLPPFEDTLDVFWCLRSACGAHHVLVGSVRFQHRRQRVARFHKDEQRLRSFRHYERHGLVRGGGWAPRRQHAPCFA